MKASTEISKAIAETSLGRRLLLTVLLLLGGKNFVLDDSSPHAGYLSLIEFDGIDTLGLVEKSRQGMRVSWSVDIIGNSFVCYHEPITLQPPIGVGIEPVFDMAFPLLHLFMKAGIAPLDPIVEGSTSAMFRDVILLLIQMVVIGWYGILGMAQDEERARKMDLLNGGDVDGPSCWKVGFYAHDLVPIQAIDTTVIGGGKTR
mmetsp:Transcript_2375/g.6893  ORF Transcript_2375/g.6893 Transcript_2375/m.6893 type:complete len:202 (-) Transcript_2375:501-1106(-)